MPVTKTHTYTHNGREFRVELGFDATAEDGWGFWVLDEEAETRTEFKTLRKAQKYFDEICASRSEPTTD